MGKYFEIRYAPDSWNTPPGGVSVAWSSPYGGLHVQAPASQIPPQYSPALNNVILRNNVIRGRPAAVIGPFPNPGAISIIGSYLPSSVSYVNTLWAVYGNGAKFLNGGSWINLTAGYGSSVHGPYICWQSFEGNIYWSGSNVAVGAQVLASGHLSVGNGGTGKNDAAFSGATNPPVAGQTCFGGAYIGELGNRIILANVGEVPAGGGQVSQFPQRIRWSNNGFNPTITVFGDNLGTAGATFDPSINSGAGLNDILDVSDVITGLMTMGRVGYVFRTNGITEFTPTGNGQAPFSFDHMWSSRQGVGNTFPFTIAQYGALGAFISSDNVYVISPSGLQKIGGGARDSILTDIQANLTAGNLPLPVGVITPGFSGAFAYLTYLLFIPQASGTKVYAYSFEDSNWMVWTLTGTGCSGQNVPSYATVYNGSTTSSYFLIPNAAAVSNKLWMLDPTNLNDATDGSSYTWRAENVAANRRPTVRRIVLEYRDHGVMTVAVSISGVDDNGTVQTVSVNKSIGTVGATGAECTAFIDISTSVFKPQVTVSRAANAGDLEITAMTMIGEVEEQQL